MDPKIAFGIALITGFAVGLIAGSVAVALIAVAAGLRDLLEPPDDEPAPLPEPEPEPKPAPALARLSKEEWEAEYNRTFERVWQETWR